MDHLARRIIGAALVMVVVSPALATAQATRNGQAIDEEYTRLIAEHLQDERITTELVDHLPASETVPTPLDFHGRIVGTPGELTYSADINRYMRAIAEASPRAEVWSMGMSEEGREMILMVIADEETMSRLDEYKAYMHELTDPRVTSPEVETVAARATGALRPALEETPEAAPAGAPATQARHRSKEPFAF